TIDVDEFIGLKSHRAKGKRISTLTVEKLEFIKPPHEELPEQEENPNGNGPAEDGEPESGPPAVESVEDAHEEGDPLFEDDSDVQMALF
ncbi:MAG: hypothetical protein LUD68_03285, partial [Rikenellaceae bacterium]|nr:hypothetical protein [Rikenellaceae bacterium]